MRLAERVAAELSRFRAPGDRILVAVSGGPDSLALLDLVRASSALHGCEVMVGHVDHGISTASREGTEALNAYLLRTDWRGVVLHRALTLGSGASETSARKARRKSLREMAGACGAKSILLAHHADDQAETVLLRVLRGSGPAGLAAMSPRRGIWLRPLLKISRDELQEYLGQRAINSWQDPANVDPQHLRSWVRTEMIPRLAARLPDVTERLQLAARHAAKARLAWDQLLGQIPDLSIQQEKAGISVAASTLNGYPSPLRTAILGTLGRRFGVPLGSRRIIAIERLLQGAEGGKVDLSVSLEAELAFDRLIFRHRQRTVTIEQQELRDAVVVGDHRFLIEDGSADLVQRTEWSTWLSPGRYLLRTWRPGDRMRPLGGSGGRAVAVLFKEAQIPPSRRRQWPVVIAEEGATIVWVPGICRGEELVPHRGARAIHVGCQSG